MHIGTHLIAQQIIGNPAKQTLFRVCGLMGCMVKTDAEMIAYHGDALMPRCRAAVAAWREAANRPGVTTEAVRAVAAMAANMLANQQFSHQTTLSGA